jgi:Na+-driven multidrug efflux pump
MPPPPPPNYQDYALLQRKYPAMFPPGGAPRYADPNLMLMGQKKSTLPSQSFGVGLAGVGANALLIVIVVMLFADPTGSLIVGDEVCCLSLFVLWVAALALSFFGILFSSISLYGVKSGKYQFHNKAKPGFILSLISGSMFILFHLGIFLFILLIEVNL